MAMSLDYIRDVYHVPADLNRRVVVDGNRGVIVGAIDARLSVLFDEAVFPVTAHPTWRVEYGEIEGAN